MGQFMGLESTPACYTGTASPQQHASLLRVPDGKAVSLRLSPAGVRQTLISMGILQELLSSPSATLSGRMKISEALKTGNVPSHS